MVPGFGFILNDSMDDFSVKGRPNATGYEPSPANYGECPVAIPRLFQGCECVCELKSQYKEGSDHYRLAARISWKGKVERSSWLEELPGAVRSFPPMFK